MRFVDSSTEAECEMIQAQCQALVACSLKDIRQGLLVLVTDKRTGGQEAILINDRSALYRFRRAFEALEELSVMGDGHFSLELISAMEKSFITDPTLLWRGRIAQPGFCFDVDKYLNERAPLHPNLHVKRHLYIYPSAKMIKKLTPLPPPSGTTIQPLAVTAANNVTHPKSVLKLKPTKLNLSFKLPSL